MTADPGSTWRRATVCTETGNCVEVARRDDGVALRNSERPEDPPLMFTRAEWAWFLNAARAGRFDDLV